MANSTFNRYSVDGHLLLLLLLYETTTKGEAQGPLLVMVMGVLVGTVDAYLMNDQSWKTNLNRLLIRAHSIHFAILVRSVFLSLGISSGHPPHTAQPQHNIGAEHTHSSPPWDCFYTTHFFDWVPWDDDGGNKERKNNPNRLEFISPFGCHASSYGRR